ncbi:unnamed protein product [Spodoptera exigua]|nr:unnamed protein product [Spodoptera exigua]
MAVVQQAMQGYHYVFDELSDSRTKDWWLVSGPGPLLTILATYLYFCTKAGPRYMKDKKPYNLKQVVMVYNICQIILSMFLSVIGITFFLTEKYENKCYSVDYSESPRAMLWATGAWWFFFAKITELMDTVFFVLRKKDRQISFLHLYHHTVMPIVGWMGVKYAAGGQAIAEGCINAFIHVVMYTYYLISGLGPEYQKYLWWKKHLTTMQLGERSRVRFPPSSAYKCPKGLFSYGEDPRTKEWFLIAKPYQTLAVLGLYLMFVLEWGPKFMKNRQPFNLDKVLIAYNSFQVLACAYVFIRSLQVAWLWDYKWICEPVDYSNSPQAMEIANICYYYFSLKIIDLLDTVFFVLRKKNNQVSFLHIYHHTGMCLLVWGAVTYLPGGHGTLIGVINSFVHVVMYAYYLLSVVMPSVKNSLRVKKHVTQLQILQFFWCVVHMAIIVFKSDCAYPRWTSAMFLPQNLFMLVLFVDFYIKTYIIKPRQQMKANLETTTVDQNNNNLPKNGAVKAANGMNKMNGLNEEKIYVKNDLNKAVNENGNNGTPYNGFCGNVNIFENGTEKSNCGNGNCRVNCHKNFKGE